jgi:hypothetical protein
MENVAFPGWRPTSPPISRLTALAPTDPLRQTVLESETREEDAPHEPCGRRKRPEAPPQRFDLASVAIPGVWLRPYLQFQYISEWGFLRNQIRQLSSVMKSGNVKSTAE